MPWLTYKELEFFTGEPLRFRRPLRRLKSFNVPPLNYSRSRLFKSVFAHNLVAFK
jgi:hypothetical protein